MRAVYIRSRACPMSTPADLPDKHATIIGALVLYDSSADQAGLEFLPATLAEGDDLLVPGVRDLGDTADAAPASTRRAAESGVRVTLLRDGLDGGVVLQVATLLEALSDNGDTRSRPRTEFRAYVRATPGRVSEIVALSAAGVVVREIAATVGLSVSTVMRVRRAHRGVPRAPLPVDGLAECLGNAD